MKVFLLLLVATAYAAATAAYDDAIVEVHKRAAQNRAERLAAYSFQSYAPPSVNTSGDFQSAIAVLYGQHTNQTVSVMHTGRYDSAISGCQVCR